MPSDFSPRLIGRHVLPASSVRNAPAAEMATKIRAGSLGSRTIVCRHNPPAPGCQADPEPWPRSPGSSCHVCPPSIGAEQGGVFNTGVDSVWIGQRRFEMPDSLEFPRMRRPVVPLVSAGDTVVHELITNRLPRLAAIVRPLDDLSEPTAGLRRIQPIRVSRRSLEMVDLPSSKVRPIDVPSFALGVRRQHERALPCANQYSYSAHPLVLPVGRPRLGGSFLTTSITPVGAAQPRRLAPIVLSIGRAPDRQGRDLRHRATAASTPVIDGDASATFEGRDDLKFGTSRHRP